MKILGLFLFAGCYMAVVWGLFSFVVWIFDDTFTIFPFIFAWLITTPFCMCLGYVAGTK